jgi:hypothetical protein
MLRTTGLAPEKWGNVFDYQYDAKIKKTPWFVFLQIILSYIKIFV